MESAEAMLPWARLGVDAAERAAQAKALKAAKAKLKMADEAPPLSGTRLRQAADEVNARGPGDRTKLAVDEAILTGESEPVNKSATLEQAAIPASERPANRVFMGTTIITGRGLMRVAHTGQQTELGQIAASIREHVEEETPLQVRLKVFSRTLTRVVVAFTLAILVSELLMGRGFLDMLRTIILAVAAVPEGLLIAVTVILALGMRKILRR